MLIPSQSTTNPLSRDVEIRDKTARLLFTFNPVDGRLRIRHRGETFEVDIEALRSALLTRDAEKFVVSVAKKDV